MHWIYLFVAGLLEIGWAVGLKFTQGFTKPIPSLLTGLAIAASMLLLSIAARTIPIGTAYAIWTGIGAAGAATIGILFLGEPATAGRIAFLTLLVVAIVGLKLTASV